MLQAKKLLCVAGLVALATGCPTEDIILASETDQNVQEQESEASASGGGGTVETSQGDTVNDADKSNDTEDSTTELPFAYPEIIDGPCLEFARTATAALYADTFENRKTQATDQGFIAAAEAWAENSLSPTLPATAEFVYECAADTCKFDIGYGDWLDYEAVFGEIWNITYQNLPDSLGAGTLLVGMDASGYMTNTIYLVAESALTDYPFTHLLPYDGTKVQEALAAFYDASGCGQYQGPSAFGPVSIEALTVAFEAAEETPIWPALTQWFTTAYLPWAEDQNYEVGDIECRGNLCRILVNTVEIDEFTFAMSASSTPSFYNTRSSIGPAAKENAAMFIARPGDEVFWP